MLWLLVRLAGLPALHTRQRRHSANTNGGEELFLIAIGFSQWIMVQNVEGFSRNK